MDILPLLCIYFVSAAFTGLTKGAGVLPDGLNAAVGDTVMFNTTVTPPEKPFISIGWSFDSQSIITFSGINITAPEYEGRITLFMSTGSLELRNVAVTDSGMYRVNIVPFGDHAQSGNVRLDVLVPVSNVITTVSSTDLLEFNSTVHLSCSSSGSSPSFLWLNGSSEVTASDRVQLTDGGANLTIVNVTRYDQEPFKCRVSNPVSSSTSDPINIIYGPGNINLISPSQEYYKEGSNITLNCSADSRPPAQFMWLLNGDLLPDTGPEHRLMNIQESQSGNYSCQAFNSKTLRYETSQPAAISVLEGISRASMTSSTNLPIEGNSVNLTCDAAGSVFTRKWMKAGSDLILAVNMTLYDNNRVLSFNSLNKKDTGEYSCEISNPVSNDKAQYFMEVNYGPENVKITVHPSEVYLKKNFTLTCSAESTPSANFTWTLNGTEIHNSAVFTKYKADFSDSGNYTCQAMNNVTGRTSSVVHQLSVTVKAHPPPLPPYWIIGIVIAVLVVFGAAGGGGYYFYKNKKRMEKLPNTATRTGGEGQDNTAYSQSQELNYADISVFQKKDGGRVQLELQNNTSEYAQVRAPSSPPTYDEHLQRTNSPDRQPDADVTYAQVHKK